MELDSCEAVFPHEKPGRRTLKAPMERRALWEVKLRNVYPDSTSQLWNSVGFCLRHAKVLKARHMGKPTHRDARSRHPQPGSRHTRRAVRRPVVHVHMRRRCLLPVRSPCRRQAESQAIPTVMIHGLERNVVGNGIRIVYRRTRNSERRHDKCGSTPLFERTHFARG